MATSESDGGFESADEELGRGVPFKSTRTATYWTSPPTVDSESDDDTEYVLRAPYVDSDARKRDETWISASSDVAMSPKSSTVDDKNDNTDSDVKVENNVYANKSVDCVNEAFDNQTRTSFSVIPGKSGSSTSETTVMKNKDVSSVLQSSQTAKSDVITPKVVSARSGKVSRSTERNLSRQSGAKKLGIKITKGDVNKTCVMDDMNTEQEIKCSTNRPEKEPLHLKKEDAECTPQEKSKGQLVDKLSEVCDIDDLAEKDMPEELKSDKKFKEIFEPEGWVSLGNDIELPDELTDEKLQPILEKLTLTSKKESENSLESWGNWGNWGVTSLINTATASVSTLTNHVSQGLTLLEDTIGVSDYTETVNQDEAVAACDEIQETQEQGSSPYSSFGFGNIISGGVSSITKLVEFTGNKVMSGGLDTLEAIGKKTMEVLQDGDPGLKKKRAFFMNETDKPILSQILREAKEHAETEERTIEERELSRKTNFESLFDDYQGLVYLEALEILSKQSSMKIQNHLIALDSHELASAEETLEEVRQLLCDLSDESEEDKGEKNFKTNLETACHDFGIDITYEKLHNIWTETEDYLASSSTRTDQEIFQNAISTLAQFTAFSVERLHKTAELLLVKERRSTVNEADALVQVTNVLSDQIISLANLFCDTLNRLIDTEKSEKSDNINATVMTIFQEAANANSYIRDASRFFIPILQIGAV